MDAPIGFFPLRDAADFIGQKVAGKEWLPLAKTSEQIIQARLNQNTERVLVLIAEQCEAGIISAAYRSITGADELDRTVWQKPFWRDYFVSGTIELDLPLLDNKLQPNANGFTARCTREVFLRKVDVERCVTTLPNSNTRPAADQRASKSQINDIVTDYRRTLAPQVRPSMQDVERFARANELRGHRSELRAEYLRQFPNQRPGRPSK